MTGGQYQMTDSFFGQLRGSDLIQRTWWLARKMTILRPAGLMATAGELAKHFVLNANLIGFKDKS